MNPDEVLLYLIELLDRLGVPYMVAGSLASSHHGRPRATNDADVVIDPDAAALDAIVAALQEHEFYVDLGRARDALSRRRQFNAIHVATAWKLDLIIRKDRPFSREEFARRQPVEIRDGAHVVMATAEDTILSKLEWARRGGGSEKQLDDVAGVVSTVRSLDVQYIEKWADALGISDLWAAVSRARGD